MKKTPQQIQNLRDALVWWPTVPEANVDLSSWRDSDTPPYTCNTIACFGGWCAVQPLLVAQGVTPQSWSGAPVMQDDDGYGGLGPSGVAIELFGDREMFYARGSHRHDKRKGSDHAAVTRRIKLALKESEQYGS